MLTTERLVLRPLTLADAKDVQRLVNSRAIAMNTLQIPFPYPAGEAERWIASHDQTKDNRVFGITLRTNGSLIGAIGLRVQPAHDHAEMGYWIAEEYWGKGYATEAASAALRYGFESLSLNRIYAQHFSRNPSSGRVLQKIGMKHEGVLRRHFKKWDDYVDVECYGILRDEFTHLLRR